MSTETQPTADETIEDAETLEARIEELETELAEVKVDGDNQQMVIIATKGTLDMAYPPLILASTAAALTVGVIGVGVRLRKTRSSDR